jgi:UDP-N-acetylglucosamine acyltransferase
MQLASGFAEVNGNQIHASAVIGPHVRLGTGNTISPGVVLAGNITIGDDNWLGAHVIIGSPPEMRGHPHLANWIEDASGAGVSIGSRNILRGGVQVHGGLYEQTRLENDLFIMNQVYIAHDCYLGDGVTMASSVAIGGHVHLGVRANLGLGTVVHQRRRIGGLTMVGMGSVVTRDLQPFVKAFGNPCRVQGVNTVGMERAGISSDVVARVVADVAAGNADGWGDVGELASYVMS